MQKLLFLTILTKQITNKKLLFFAVSEYLNEKLLNNNYSMFINLAAKGVWYVILDHWQYAVTDTVLLQLLLAQPEIDRSTCRLCSSLQELRQSLKLESVLEGYRYPIYALVFSPHVNYALISPIHTNSYHQAENNVDIAVGKRHEVASVNQAIR